jgi:FixJ family two-component response regulator
LADVGTRHEAAATLQKYLVDHPTLPFIAMSCSSNVNLAVAYTRMGAVSFLQKPVLLDMLLQTVRNGCQLSRRIFDYCQQRREFESRLQKLSPREHEVLMLVIDGLSSSQIARKLNLSIKTVSLHRTNLMNKLQANGVVHLVRMITPTPLPRFVAQWPVHQPTAIPE